MSPFAMIFVLLGWACLAAGFVMDSSVSPWLRGAFALLAAAHVAEFLAFRQVFEGASGSRASHLFRTLVFGVFHIQAVRAAAGAASIRP